MPTPLASLVPGRDNNFNLLRLLAAGVVVYSHSFPIALGARDPLEQALGYSLGEVAVDIFFFISGFLIMGSLVSSHSLRQFIAARILRIYPGLAAATLLTILALGLGLSSLPFADFLRHPDTLAFLTSNTALLAGKLQNTLPGVFEQNAIQVVNGSLWTLPWEVSMYLLMACLGWLFLVPPPVMNAKTLKIITSLVTALGFLAYASNPLYAGYRFIFLFFGGALYHQWKDSIVLSGRVVLLIVAFTFYFYPNPSLLFGLYNLGIGYIILWLAYIPSGWVRHYNRLGDYSYGLYIYAYPVQQAIEALDPSGGPLRNFALALPITLTLAVLSWHLLEKPMLALKAKF